MTLVQAAALKNGLYRVHWKQAHGGGYSLAALGRDGVGTPWLAPVNWISGSTTDRWWSSVERMELLVDKATPEPAKLHVLTRSSSGR